MSLLAVWFFSGVGLTILAAAALFEDRSGPARAAYGLPEPPTFLGLPAEAYEAILFASVVVGWPIALWPAFTRTVRAPEEGWGGYLGWLAVWFPVSQVTGFFLCLGLFPLEGSGWGGGIVLAAQVATFAASFVAIWIVPRVLIPWLRPGAFAPLADCEAAPRDGDGTGDPSSG